MTEIFIDPSKSKIEVQVTSQSLHTLGFNITVFASDKTTVIEEHSGSTQTNNPFVQKLNKKPSDYKGTYINGDFTVMSPSGDDVNPYTIVFSILEDDIVLKPEIILNGTTTGGEDTIADIFHLN
jgi:hypothetical protein